MLQYAYYNYVTRKKLNAYLRALGFFEKSGYLITIQNFHSNKKYLLKLTVTEKNFSAQRGETFGPNSFFLIFHSCLIFPPKFVPLYGATPSLIEATTDHHITPYYYFLILNSLSKRLDLSHLN